MFAIAPSILSADFARLGEEVHAAQRGGADRIHVDVMDGHFVPNLSIGPAIVSSLKPATPLPLEVHLMVAKPLAFTESFAKAGAATLIGHLEVLPDPTAFIREVQARGLKVGLAINPNTAVEQLEPHLPDIDLALCMTVYPGFSGQAYIPGSAERVRRLAALIASANPACELEVDGGITEKTAAECARAGATVFVAASAIFRSPAGAEAATRSLAEVVAANRSG